MKSETQPSNQPRYVRLRVHSIIQILQDCPPEAFIQFAEGGFLEARADADWANVEVIDEKYRVPVVKTKWT
jgi:hypothetical protein